MEYIFERGQVFTYGAVSKAELREYVRRFGKLITARKAR